MTSPNEFVDHGPKGLPIEGRLPIVVGVTGHRDLREEDAPMLEEAARRRLLGLLEAFPHTPVVVLDALAEGADQLVARVVIELREKYAGRLFLVAPLPWSAEDYAATFEQEQTKARSVLGGILDACDASYTIADIEGHAVPDVSENENEGFRRLAAFLVRNAHVLLCLSEAAEDPAAQLPGGEWDGGTGTVQAWFRRGLPACYSPGVSDIDIIDGLALMHVPVRRRQSGDVPAPMIPEWSAPPASASDEETPIDAAPFGRGRVIFENFEGFNRTLEAERPRFEAEIARSGASLLSYDQDPPPPAVLTPLRDAYAAADVLTDRRFRPYMEHFGTIAVVAVIVSLVAFEVFTHVAPGSYGFLVLYVVLSLSLPPLYHFLIRKRSVDEKRLLYRSFAESLRLQAYWRYAGVEQMVSHHYARHARNEVEWVRQAVRGFFPCTGPLPKTPAAWDRVQEVTEHWVEDQASWFRNKVAREIHPKERLVGIISSSGLILGFGIALFLLVRTLTGAGVAHDGHLDHTTHLWIAGMITAIGIAGIGQWVEHTKAYGPLARRYQAQAEIYERAGRELRATLEDRTDLGRAQQILYHLGRATLQENTSWLLLFRNRPLEIHWH